MTPRRLTSAEAARSKQMDELMDAIALALTDDGPLLDAALSGATDDLGRSYRRLLVVNAAQHCSSVAAAMFMSHVRVPLVPAPTLSFTVFGRPVDCPLAKHRVLERNSLLLRTLRFHALLMTFKRFADAERKEPVHALCLPYIVSAALTPLQQSLFLDYTAQVVRCVASSGVEPRPSVRPPGSALKPYMPDASKVRFKLSVRGEDTNSVLSYVGSAPGAFQVCSLAVTALVFAKVSPRPDDVFINGLPKLSQSPARPAERPDVASAINLLASQSRMLPLHLTTVPSPCSHSYAKLPEPDDDDSEPRPCLHALSPALAPKLARSKRGTTTSAATSTSAPTAPSRPPMRQARSRPTAPSA